jgi:rod shape-determining protein MreC
VRQLTRRQRRAAIALALVAAFFCALDIAGAPFAGARGGVQGFFGGLYRGTDSVLGPARTWVQALPDLNHNSKTITSLRNQVADLKRAQAIDTNNATTAKLVSDLQLQADRGGYIVLPARVTAIGADGGFDWTVVLDAGSEDGVTVDQTVIAGPDLVGRIIRVSASSSTVLLAADPKSGVGVRDIRSGRIGVVTGRGTDGYTYAGLDPTVAPKIGDLLISGPAKSTTYVAGLTVGTVASVTPGLSGTTVVTVKSSIAPDVLDVVGIVLVGGQRPTRTALTPSGTPSVAAQGPR